jgi:hypothetical protein
MYTDSFPLPLKIDQGPVKSVSEKTIDPSDIFWGELEKLIEGKLGDMGRNT